MERSEGHLRLSRTQRALIAVVVVGAVVIAGIGFAGSYAAVRELAIRKGFGDFAAILPIGIDAGIAVLLALDLLLTWLRIPFPMLRQTAWLLTAATIVFNAATAWPDPVGVGMHGVIPILFVVTVEAARHAVGRLAAITADRHMEGVRFWRWLLAPLPTFRLWRRMKLWEIRKYDEVIRAEQQRLVYQARLRGRFGRGWRWKAPIDELLPLRIARYGVPLEAPPIEARAHPRGAAGKAEDDGLEATPVLNAGVGASGSSDLGEVALDQESRRTTEPPFQAEGGFGLSEEQQAGTDETLEDAATTGMPSRGAEPPADAKDSIGKEDPDLPAAPRDGAASHGSTAFHDGEAEPAKTRQPREVAAPPRKSGAEAVREKRASDGPGQGLADAEHQEAVARLKSNAAAVRYAMKVLGSTHTPTVVDWLSAQGREVNRGQAHRITKEEDERQQRSWRLSTVKSPS
ncbi:DUF2637 domain-containing protein [Streptomyces sp. NPDC057552]|uniref:DUF2637 domain-containing protein n=1 Tax=Streptomyces sp. NPDC057552 TaxID=3350537 RepID=UPI00369C34A0